MTRIVRGTVIRPATYSNQSFIETLNYCCLKHTSQSLSSFNVLVGPNASGKTTFMDVASFLSQLVSRGLEAAVSERTANFHDLIWKKSGDHFDLAIEAVIPEHIREKLAAQRPDRIRYEVSVGMNQHDEISILTESGFLKTVAPVSENPGRELPDHAAIPGSLCSSFPDAFRIFHKRSDGKDEYCPELHSPQKENRKSVFRLGHRKSVLGNLPEDESLFPVSVWFKDLLIRGIRPFVLNSLLIRKASPPGQVRGFRPDGSNLPWIIAQLKKNDPERFRDWIQHLQTALPDIEDILIRDREDDRHRYLMISYRGGTEVPSWMVSDGTLRLLALTLPAYLTDFEGIYLIEEPENGIHPRAVETMIQSLSSVYNAQILLATHSPVIVSLVSPDQILCFAGDREGATGIVPGHRHPELGGWRGEENLGVLYAAGVLG